MPQITPQQAYELAVQYHQSGRLAEAESLYRQILAEQPNHVDAMDMLARLNHQMGQHAVAADLLRRAIELQPAAANLHSNLGMILATGGRIDEAIPAFVRAIALRPDVPESHNNLGNALREKGRYEEAFASYKQAVTLRPRYPDARWNLGLLLLMHGDFEHGWPLYEARREVTSFQFQSNVLGTTWDGSPLNGRRILLQAEQGFGDTIQFIRYAPLVADRGGRVIAHVQPELKRLLSGQCRIEQVAAEGDVKPLFDVSCTLLTLPRVFNTTPQTIPAQVPYIRPDPLLVEQWRARVSREPQGLKVGLSWAGRPTHPGDRNRSIPLPLLARLAQAPGVRFYSLQKWRPSGPQPPAPFDLIDWTADMTDFADSAALIANLDLVISVDTAVAHLAGAIAKPIWLLLPFVPDWRWMLHRTDSPWYPTMRLFRQPALDDWNMPIENAARQLSLVRAAAPSITQS